MSASANDAEESPTGVVTLNSTTLQLVNFNGGNQTVGLRWTGLTIPNGSTITAAYIQFYSSASQSGATSLALQGVAADSPTTFTTAPGNISTRPRTVSSVNWTPPAWLSGEVNTNERTPDLTAVVQEVVGRPGWASGNALAMIITGTGVRTAYTYDAKHTRAALLHVEYIPPDFPPVANLSVTQPPTPALTVTASGSGSTDTDVTPIATYQFDFGDGSPVVVATAPTSSAQHTYAAAGTYTVTLTATDTGNNVSAPVTKSITVQPDLPPTASLSVTQLSSPNYTVSANGSGSTDTDLTPIASYHFDFGDGSPVVNTTAPTATAQHTYAGAGTYTVTLTVTDTGNNTSAPATASIIVNPPPDNPPVASLTVTQPPTPALTVNASGAGSTDTDLTPIATYQFNFGDGSPVVVTTAPTATAQHAYAAAGAYTVTLTVTDTGNNVSAPVTRSITVQPDLPPTASLSATQVASPALTVSANGSGSTDADLTPIASYQFDFGDGSPVVVTTAPTATAQHTYAATGTYTVTLTATDTGNNTSAPATASVTVVAQVDLAPVASVKVTPAASPPLTVTADGSGSTDTDATPIATYQFNFGDGTPVVVTTAPTSSAQHTYAAAGTYTVTLTATDTGNNTSAPATASITVTQPPAQQVAVYVGYYDTHHAVNPQPKPNPWRGSSNTVFVGTQDNQPGDPPGGGWDTSCLRVDNLTAGSLSIVATVDIGTHHYALWGTNTVPAGNSLVLAQTAFENFDGSDLNAAGCYGCDPSQCTTLYNSTIPVVHVTVSGTTINYNDTGQYLNTHGVDAAGCPYVGGPLPQTRYDESEAWQRVYPQGQAPPSQADPTSPAALLASAPQTTLWLGAPVPNPSRGDLFVRFTMPVHGPVRLDLYDLAGRLVRPCISNVLDAASYGFKLDLSDVNPGIYFVNLSTPLGSRHQRLVLMR